MAPKPVIKQLLAGIMLLVFTFSIAPKKFLHDAIANHTDKSIVVAAGDNAQLSHAGFICKCDNLVAESPFTNEAQHFDFAVVQVFSVQQSLPVYNCCSASVIYLELRGPPAPSSAI